MAEQKEPTLEEMKASHVSDVRKLFEEKGSVSLDNPEAVRKWLLASNPSEQMLHWVNNNVDKWFAEGKSVTVKGANDFIPKVIDRDGNPDMSVLGDWVGTQKSDQAKELPLADAKRVIAANKALKDVADQFSERPAGMSQDLWQSIKTVGGQNLKAVEPRLEAMYREGERISLQQDGSLNTGAAESFEKQKVLATARQAQEYIASRANSAVDAEKEAWSKLAARPGVIKDFYDTSSKNKLTITGDGKLDVTALVKWSATKDKHTRSDMDAALLALGNEDFISARGDRFKITPVPGTDGINVVMGNVTVDEKSYSIVFAGTSNGREAVINNVILVDDKGSPVSDAKGNVISDAFAQKKPTTFKVQDGQLLYPVGPGLPTVSEDLRDVPLIIFTKQKQSFGMAATEARRVTEQQMEADRRKKISDAIDNAQPPPPPKPLTEQEAVDSIKTVLKELVTEGKVPLDTAKESILVLTPTIKDAYSAGKKVTMTHDGGLDISEIKEYWRGKPRDLSAAEQVGFVSYDEVRKLVKKKEPPAAPKPEITVKKDFDGRHEQNVDTGSASGKEEPKGTDKKEGAPKKTPEGFFEKNKMGLGAGLIGAVLGLAMGGQILGALIMGAILFMAVGAMADKGGEPAKFFNSWPKKSKGAGTPAKVNEAGNKEHESSQLKTVSVNDIEHISAPAKEAGKTRFNISEGDLKGAAIIGKISDDGKHFEVSAIARADAPDKIEPLPAPMNLPVINGQINLKAAEELTKTIKASPASEKPKASTIKAPESIASVVDASAVIGQITGEDGMVYHVELQGKATGRNAVFHKLVLRSTSTGETVEQPLPKLESGTMTGTGASVSPDVSTRILQTIAPDALKEYEKTKVPDESPEVKNAASLSRATEAATLAVSGKLPYASSDFDLKNPNAPHTGGSKSRDHTV